MVKSPAFAKHHTLPRNAPLMALPSLPTRWLRCSNSRHLLRCNVRPATPFAASHCEQHPLCGSCSAYPSAKLDDVLNSVFLKAIRASLSRLLPALFSYYLHQMGTDDSSYFDAVTQQKPSPVPLKFYLPFRLPYTLCFAFKNYVRNVAKRVGRSTEILYVHPASFVGLSVS